MAAATRWRVIGCRADVGVTISHLSLHDASGALDSAVVPLPTLEPVAGACAALTDGDDATSATFTAAQLAAPGFALVWEFGAAVEVRAVLARYAGGPWREATLQYETPDGWRTQFAFVPAGRQDLEFTQLAALWLLDATLADFGPAGAVLNQVNVGAQQYWAQGHAPYAFAAQFAPGLFNANPSLVNRGAGLGAFGTGDFEFALWVNLDAAAGQSYGRIAETKLFGTQGGWNLVQIDRTQRITLHLSDGTRLLEQDLAKGWHYVEVRRVAGQIGLLVDGALLQTTPSTHDFSAPDFALGGNLNGQERSACLVNEVRLVKGRSRPLASYALPAETATRWDRDTLLRTTVVKTYALDREFGGAGAIYGTTEIRGTPDIPTGTRVTLLRQRDLVVARQTWSNARTGAFRFEGIDPAQQFLALAEDSAGNYRPVAANRLVPEVQP